MDIALRRASDAGYAEKLTRTNMGSYYQSRNMTWDAARFSQSWQEFDNFEVWCERRRVGVVRFSYSQRTTFLRDFQLTADFQGQGVGYECLVWIIKHAQSHQSENVVLRVFAENPAIRLYQKFGFVQTAEVNGLVEMEFKLR